MTATASGLTPLHLAAFYNPDADAVAAAIGLMVSEGADVHARLAANQATPLVSQPSAVSKGGDWSPWHGACSIPSHGAGCSLKCRLLFIVLHQLLLTQLGLLLPPVPAALCGNKPECGSGCSRRSGFACRWR